MGRISLSASSTTALWSYNCPRANYESMWGASNLTSRLSRCNTGASTCPTWKTNPHRPPTARRCLHCRKHQPGPARSLSCNARARLRRHLPKQTTFGITTGPGRSHRLWLRRPHPRCSHKSLLHPLRKRCSRQRGRTSTAWGTPASTRSRPSTASLSPAGAAALLVLLPTSCAGAATPYLPSWDPLQCSKADAILHVQRPKGMHWLFGSDRSDFVMTPPPSDHQQDAHGGT